MYYGGTRLARGRKASTEATHSPGIERKARLVVTKVGRGREKESHGGGLIKPPAPENGGGEL